MENWKDIKGYENLYQVSDLGRIKRVDSIIKSSNRNGGYRICNGRILKQNLKRNGYLTVDLSKNGETKTISVHRIVAINLVPNPNNYTYVDHINCNKQDNRVSNLEWVTAKENSRRQVQNKCQTYPWQKRVRNKQLNKEFENSFRAAEYINNEYFGNSKQVRSIASKIRACCNNKQKSACGFTWEYM